MGNNKIKTYYSEREVESATGERFETYAQYLLNLIHPHYIGTRIHKDGGVDGLILCREVTMKKPPVFYSIYGPERYTGWLNKFNKIKKDVAKIKTFAKGKYEDFTINFIVNFRLESNEITEMDAFMKAERIPYEFIDPSRLFASLLGGPVQLTNAVAFIDGIEEAQRDLTDWNNHVFAGEVLKVLNSFDEKDDLSAKMKLILQMRTQLITFISHKDFRIKTPFATAEEVEKKGARLFVVPDREVLKQNTQVNHGCRTVYLINSNSQHVQRLSEREYENMYAEELANRPSVFRIGQKTIAVKIENLEVLYSILHLSFHSFEIGGQMDLFDILRRIAITEANMLRRKENKDKNKIG